jgi:hypothetical protein
LQVKYICFTALYSNEALSASTCPRLALKLLGRTIRLRRRRSRAFILCIASRSFARAFLRSINSPRSSRSLLPAAYYKWPMEGFYVALFFSFIRNTVTPYVAQKTFSRSRAKIWLSAIAYFICNDFSPTNDATWPLIILQ